MKYLHLRTIPPLQCYIAIYLLTLVKILQADGGHGGDIFRIKKAYCKTTLKNLNTERYLLPDLIKKKTNRSTGPGRKEV
jgi:hypothetical protein